MLGESPITFTEAQAKALGMDWNSIPPEQKVTQQQQQNIYGGVPVQESGTDIATQKPSEVSREDAPINPEEKVDIPEVKPTDVLVKYKITPSLAPEETMVALKKAGASDLEVAQYVQAHPESVRGTEAYEIAVTSYASVKELSSLTGKSQFNKAVQMGIVPAGSVYVPTADGQWSYIPKESLDKWINSVDKSGLVPKETLTEIINTEGYPAAVSLVNQSATRYEVEYTKLPDGKLIANSALSELKNTNSDAYNVLMTEGYDVYSAKMQKALSAMSPYKQLTPETEKAWIKAELEGKILLPEAKYTYNLTDAVNNVSDDDIKMLFGSKALEDTKNVLAGVPTSTQAEESKNVEQQFLQESPLLKTEVLTRALAGTEKGFGHSGVPGYRKYEYEQLTPEEKQKALTIYNQLWGQAYGFPVPKTIEIMLPFINSRQGLSKEQSMEVALQRLDSVTPAQRIPFLAQAGFGNIEQRVDPESGIISYIGSAQDAETIWNRLTPEQRNQVAEAYLRTRSPEEIEAARAFVRIVPGAGTVLNWNEMSPGWRAVSIASDLAFVLSSPMISPYISKGWNALVDKAKFVFTGKESSKAAEQIARTFANYSDELYRTSEWKELRFEPVSSAMSQYGDDLTRATQLADTLQDAETALATNRRMLEGAIEQGLTEQGIAILKQEIAQQTDDIARLSSQIDILKSKAIESRTNLLKAAGGYSNEWQLKMSELGEEAFTGDWNGDLTTLKSLQDSPSLTYQKIVQDNLKSMPKDLTKIVENTVEARLHPELVDIDKLAEAIDKTRIELAQAQQSFPFEPRMWGDLQLRLNNLNSQYVERLIGDSAQLFTDLQDIREFIKYGNSQIENLTIFGTQSETLDLVKEQISKAQQLEQLIEDKIISHLSDPKLEWIYGEEIGRGGGRTLVKPQTPIYTGGGGVSLLSKNAEIQAPTIYALGATSPKILIPGQAQPAIGTPYAMPEVVVVEPHLQVTTITPTVEPFIVVPEKEPDEPKTKPFPMHEPIPDWMPFGEDEPSTLFPVHPREPEPYSTGIEVVSPETSTRKPNVVESQPETQTPVAPQTSPLVRTSTIPDILTEQGTEGLTKTETSVKPLSLHQQIEEFLDKTQTQPQVFEQAQEQVATQTQTEAETQTQTVTDVLAETEVLDAKLIGIKLPDDETDKALIAKIKPGTVTWQQGRPYGFPDGLWRVLPPPYRQEDMFVMKHAPPGAYKFASGKGSAYKTIQVIGGRPTQDADVDLGIAKIHIDARNMKISFRPSDEANVGARSETIGMGEGQIPYEGLERDLAERRGEVFGEEVTENIPRGERLKVEPPRGLRKLELPQYRMGRTKVFLVSGDFIRQTYGEESLGAKTGAEFNGVGHHYNYENLIPKNEIWIDHSLEPDDREKVLLRAIAERENLSRGVQGIMDEPIDVKDALHERIREYNRPRELNIDRDIEVEDSRNIPVAKPRKRRVIGTGSELAPRYYLGHKIDTVVHG